MDQNTNLEIEYSKIRSAFIKDRIFKDYQKGVIKNNIRFFISKLLGLLPESTPNRGCLGSKLESFRCKFCTNRVGLGVFSTPIIGVECIEIIDVAGKPRLPKEPRKSGYE